MKTEVERTQREKQEVLNEANEKVRASEHSKKMEVQDVASNLKKLETENKDIKAQAQVYLRR